MKNILRFMIIVVCIFTMQACCITHSEVSCSKIIFEGKIIDISSTTLLNIYKAFDKQYQYNSVWNVYVFGSGTETPYGDGSMTIQYSGTPRSGYTDNIEWDEESQMPPYSRIKQVCVNVYGEDIKTFSNVCVGDSFSNFEQKLVAVKDYVVINPSEHTYFATESAYIMFDNNLNPTTDPLESCVHIGYEFSNNSVSRIFILYDSPYDYEDSITEPLNLALSESY